MTSSHYVSAAELTHRVILISHQLGLYQAELARILQIQCADIGRLTSGKGLLEPASLAWQQAGHLARLYELLQDRLEGDEVAMYHWLRVRNDYFEKEPLLMMVDHGQLESVIGLLESGHGIRRVNPSGSLARQGDDEDP